MISLERRATHNHDRKISWSRLLPDCSSSSSAQLHSNLKCLFPFYARNPCALFPSRQADEAANSWSKSRSVRNPNTRIAAQLRVPSMWWQNLATGCFFFFIGTQVPDQHLPLPYHPTPRGGWLMGGKVSAVHNPICILNAVRTLGFMCFHFVIRMWLLSVVVFAVVAGVIHSMGCVVLIPGVLPPRSWLF